MPSTSNKDEKTTQIKAFMTDMLKFHEEDYYHIKKFFPKLDYGVSDKTFPPLADGGHLFLLTVSNQGEMTGFINAVSDIINTST